MIREGIRVEATVDEILLVVGSMRSQPSDGAPFSRSEMAEVAQGLQRLLEAVAAGTLTADPGLVARLDGARAVLEKLAMWGSPG